MAEIIVLADRILDPATPRGTVLDAAFNLGGIYEKIQLFLRGDKQTGGQRERKSLLGDIKKGLEVLGLNTRNKILLSWLKKEGIAYQHGENVVVINGKNISLRSFRRLVSKVKLSMKIAVSH